MDQQVLMMEKKGKEPISSSSPPSNSLQIYFSEKESGGVKEKGLRCDPSTEKEGQAFGVGPSLFERYLEQDKRNHALELQELTQPLYAAEGSEKQLARAQSSLSSRDQNENWTVPSFLEKQEVAKKSEHWIGTGLCVIILSSSTRCLLAILRNLKYTQNLV